MSNCNGRIPLIAVVGCTAGGKSALALSLAQRFGGEVISCDSMQVYREMDIGTAKPTPEQMQGIAHRMIDILPPDAPFSVGEYVRMAKAEIAQTVARGNLPIVCGGTGLYLDALLRGQTPPPTDTDPAFRAELTAFAQQNGNEALHARLAASDPESAAAIHPNNVRRVIRALEILHTTGKTKSETDRLSLVPPSEYDACVLGLRYADRGVLYARIDRRVEEMFDRGLCEETRRLRGQGVFERSPTAAQAIGYKELFPYLDGLESRRDALLRLQSATRHYAKRQMTWFYAKNYIRWIEMTENGAERPYTQVVAEAEQILTDAGFVPVGSQNGK